MLRSVKWLTIDINNVTEQHVRPLTAVQQTLIVVDQVIKLR